MSSDLTNIDELIGLIILILIIIGIVALFYFAS